MGPRTLVPSTHDCNSSLQPVTPASGASGVPGLPGYPHTNVHTYGLSYGSVVVKRHWDQGKSYKRKLLTGELARSFRELVH